MSDRHTQYLILTLVTILLTALAALAIWGKG